MNSVDYTKLLETAKEAVKNSYAPYSNIHVSAALLTSNGNIFTGVNVENSSYGLTICAERSAVSSAIVNGEKEFEAMAIYSNEIRPIMPCGACRQVLSEFNPSITLVMSDKDGKQVIKTLDEIFATPFLLNENK